MTTLAGLVCADVQDGALIEDKQCSSDLVRHVKHAFFGFQGITLSPRKACVRSFQSPRTIRLQRLIVRHPRGIMIDGIKIAGRELDFQPIFGHDKFDAIELDALVIRGESLTVAAHNLDNIPRRCRIVAVYEVVP